MNIETAQRLLEYRKANGYSQEELAEKIGVSRQAISKWERSESSPDTDNLIALSNLYGVTIDELIHGNDKPKKAESVSNNSNAENVENNGSSAENKKSDNVHIGWDGIHIESKNGDNVHVGGGYGVHVESGNEDWKHFYDKDKENIKKAAMPRRNPQLHALIPLTILLVYLIMGFIFPRSWAVGWILFLLIPIIETAITAFRTKNPMRFAYPVLAAAIFLFEGMVFHVWHPTWIIFLTIPIYYLVCDAFRRGKELKEDDYPEYQQASDGTYYQPPGADVTLHDHRVRAHRAGSTVTKVVIAIVSAITIIAVVAIISVFGWLGGVSGGGSFISGLFNSVPYSTWSNGNDTKYTAGNGEVSAAGITQLSINWVSDSVTVEYYDGNTISFSEPEHSDLDYALRYLVDGNELKINYCKSGLKWTLGALRDKDLTVYLPKGLVLDEIDIETISADVALNGLTAKEIELNAISGNINAFGSFTNINVETVSGGAEIIALTKPTSMDFETVSGRMKVYIPEDISGFTVTYDSVSGGASVNDFEVSMPQSKTYKYGDGSTRIDFESVSGNIEIKKAK